MDFIRFAMRWSGEHLRASSRDARRAADHSIDDPSGAAGYLKVSLMFSPTFLTPAEP